MHILMDKGLRLQDVWPGAPPFASNTELDNATDLANQLAFWRKMYPAKIVENFWLPPAGIRNTTFWPALCIMSHTPTSQYDMLRQHWLPNIAKLDSVAWLAVTGDGFHGQRQRSWQAMQGNMHLSVGIKPNLSATRFSYALTMLPAVCLMDILMPYGLDNKSTGIKWVNDVLVNRKKIAGVLTSARTENSLVTGAVLGFGLNIACAPRLSESSFVQGSTCLHDHLGTQTPCLGDLVLNLLASVAQRLKELQLKGPELLYRAYTSHSLILGQDVQIWPEEAGGIISDKSGSHPLRQGVVQSIQPDLSLILSGQSDPVTSGRLVWKPATDKQKTEL